MKKINSLLIYLKNNNFSKQYNFLKKIAGLDGLMTHEIIKVDGQTLESIAADYKDRYNELDQYKGKEITPKIVKDYHNDNIYGSLEAIPDTGELGGIKEILIPVTWYYVDEEEKKEGVADKGSDTKDLGSFQYTIESGDTLSNLAKFYEIKINDIKNKDGSDISEEQAKKLKPGFVVTIPLAEGRGTIDEEVLASALMAEGGSVHGKEMMKKIYTVIKNRMNHGCFPNSAIEVVEEKNQFEYTIRSYEDSKGAFKPYPSNKMRFIRYWKNHKFGYIKKYYKDALKIVKSNETSSDTKDCLFFITKSLYKTKKLDEGDMWGNGCFLIKHSDDGHHYGTLNFSGTRKDGKTPCRITNCKATK